MRNTFANVIGEQAKQDKRIVLLTGDLGFSVFEQYRDSTPEQYINCGIVEQSMTGIAAGLATEGYIPIIYSIIPFVTMRNYEQIRNDICYQKLHVLIVGVGAGFSYGPYGYTHHSLEDITLMRSLPGMTVLCPGDPVEAKALTTQALEIHGPVYIRIGKTGEQIIHENESIRIGKGSILTEGSDITLFVTSTMLQVARGIQQELLKQHIHTRVVSIHTVKPIDKEIIYDSMKKTKLLVTLEEHSIIGGLGSAVAEIVSQQKHPKQVIRLGVDTYHFGTVGTQEYVRDIHGLSKEKIVDTIVKHYVDIANTQ